MIKNLTEQCFNFENRVNSTEKYFLQYEWQSDLFVYHAIQVYCIVNPIKYKFSYSTTLLLCTHLVVNGLNNTYYSDD